MATSCQVCENAQADGTLTLTGLAGILSGPACMSCATDALASARCDVRFVPTLAVAA